ncbi:hypothetical protein PX343_06880 [Citrobacter koseri]|uniref:hypothetical protein n=1 Tax=Citrobacter koseri TaxID=545 RepID=UPI0023AA5899|nr:hypothetical protein [Citrobacter koseri]WEE18630.1 hypothetical protein PX343_06880 [Citrobacter koseri]
MTTITRELIAAYLNGEVKTLTNSEQKELARIALASLDAGSNSHPAPVPLSNDRLHRISDILSKAAAQSDGGNLGYAMSDAVKAIDELLASRGSRPVYQYQSGIYNEDNGETDWYWDDCDIGFYEQYAADRRRILYTAPPVPVVPEAKFDDDGNTTSEFDHGWNACRAAILESLPAIKPAPKLDSMAKNDESLPGNKKQITSSMAKELTTRRRIFLLMATTLRF